MRANTVDEPKGSSPQPSSQESEPWLQPWQFFLLGGMLAATATVIVATGQSPANIIILSVTVVSVSLVGLGAYRMLLPLVAKDVEAPPMIAGRTRAALEREKTLVLRSIKELEFDFAMGKVAKADFDEMSARLRARAGGLIRQLDAGGYKELIAKEVEIRLKADTTYPDEIRLKADTTYPDEIRLKADTTYPADTAYRGANEEKVKEGSCPSCGTKNDEDAKFCKNCGAKL